MPSGSQYEMRHTGLNKNRSSHGFAGCPYRKSNPEVLVMQSAEDRDSDYAADPLDGPSYGAQAHSGVSARPVPGPRSSSGAGA